MMISLPSKWIKANKLDKGSEVDVEEKANEIIIKTITAKRENKAIIEVSNYSPMVNRLISSLYIKGIDELEVKFKEKNEVKDFQKRVINELLGFEIIKSGQNSFTLKDITGSEAQEIDELIKRIFFILDSMAQELIIAIKEKQDLSPIIDIDESVNKFVNFCLRVLNKRGYKDYKKTPQIYGIVSALEEIGDLYKKIAIEAKHKSIKEYLLIIRDLQDSLKLVETLLFSYNKEKEIELAKKYDSIKRKPINGKIDFYLYELNETIIKMNNYLLVISI